MRQNAHHILSSALWDAAASEQSRHKAYLSQAAAVNLWYLRSFGFHITAACCGFIGCVCGALWKPGFTLTLIAVE